MDAMAIVLVNQKVEKLTRRRGWVPARVRRG